MLELGRPEKMAIRLGGHGEAIGDVRETVARETYRYSPGMGHTAHLSTAEVARGPHVNCFGLRIHQQRIRRQP
jgi:hypothetical protein